MQPLSPRALNRALLARQLLLERSPLSPLEATEQLICLQAQIPNPPYIGLWTRLQTFSREAFTRLMEERQIVRAVMLRSTLHHVSAADHQLFRLTLAPALEKAFKSFFGKYYKGINAAKIVDAARPFLTTEPRSMGELEAYLLEIEPTLDPTALRYAVRTYLPLVQIPPGGTWGTGSRASYLTAEAWLGPLADGDQLPQLFRRYLAAFGPASIMDFQTWTGMTGLKKALETLRPELQCYQDEKGRELFDLPDCSLPDSQTAAPVRFIPEYDNLLIAHADRSRILPPAYHKKVFLSAGRVRSTILVDGFVAGAWKIERSKDRATLNIEQFESLSAKVQNELAAEGVRLVQFVEDEVEEIAVVFDEA